MANYQKRLVYLTDEQRELLFANGTLTVNGTTITYSDDDVYVTPQATPLYPTDIGSGLTISSGKVVVTGKLDSSLKGASGGIAELDSNGKVPSAQLPSFVDDVVECANQAAFPATGETDKIYVDKETNKTYRWGGTGYVEISASLALGETAQTAYRGDRGKAAYDHAAAKGSAFSSGLYKITTNAEGHVTAATPVTKADITALDVWDLIVPGTANGSAKQTGFTWTEDSTTYTSSNTASGIGSFVEGSNNEATAKFAHAEGRENHATNQAAHAEGQSNTASGAQAHAEGAGNTASGPASHAENNMTTASGNASHAEGGYTTAQGMNSHAEGNRTTAVGSGSHAEGVQAPLTVDGEDVTTITYNNTEYSMASAVGIGSHSEGGSTVAIGAASHAEGGYTLAGGDYSHAEGNNTKANGQMAHAEGYNTRATGDRSHAEGSGTQATSTYAHAEGNGSVATNYAAHAEGIATYADGAGTHTQGRYNKRIAPNLRLDQWESGKEYARGDCVYVGSTGYQCKTANDDATFDSSKWYAFAGTFADSVGNGFADADRSNAYALDWNGTGYFAGDVYVGCNYDSSGGTLVAKISDVPTEELGASVNNMLAGMGLNASAYYEPAVVGSADVGHAIVQGEE